MTKSESESSSDPECMLASELYYRVFSFILRKYSNFNRDFLLEDSATAGKPVKLSNSLTSKPFQVTKKLIDEINEYTLESSIFSWLEQCHSNSLHPPKISYRITNLCSSCQFSQNWLTIDSRELFPYTASSWEELGSQATDYGCLLSSSVKKRLAFNESSPECVNKDVFLAHESALSQQVLPDLCVNCCSFTGVEVGSSDVLEVSVNTVQTVPYNFTLKCPMCQHASESASPNATLKHLRKTCAASPSPSSSSDMLRRISVENRRLKNERSSRKSSFDTPCSVVEHFRNLGEPVLAPMTTEPVATTTSSASSGMVQASSPLVLVVGPWTEVELGVPVVCGPPKKQPCSGIDRVTKRLNQLQTHEQVPGAVTKTVPIPTQNSNYFPSNSAAFFNRQTGLPLQSSPVSPPPLILLRIASSK
ncbi:hypothetical protein Ciccas_008519 [Cichlidogyrus casuarinus]|uniref:Uncharacterized protein n=1 Tax=Cichlidogyrus casuarinus TaxID=1844966 RepID=A0ABD2PZR6_9PLAT